jgi:DNA-binding NarL/FixJ family response regulator
MSPAAQAAQGRPKPAGIPARILVAGSDLLAGAVASALETHGFATMEIAPRKAEIERGIEWQPDLALIDVRTLDVTTGSSLLRPLHRVGLEICVMDEGGDDDRLQAWLGAGASALIDKNEPFDQLFRTVNRLLRFGSMAQMARRQSGSHGVTIADGTIADGQPRSARQKRFATLTEREQFVLAELMEGHNAEEIATAAFVSISTVRSQIKAILQKLGVNSQLAAVAMARRAGWSLDHPPRNSPKPSSGRRKSVS